MLKRNQSTEAISVQCSLAVPFPTGMVRLPRAPAVRPGRKVPYRSVSPRTRAGSVVAPRAVATTKVVYMRRNAPLRRNPEAMQFGPVLRYYRQASVFTTISEGFQLRRTRKLSQIPVLPQLSSLRM
jgi:hypothetical protein